MTTSWALLIDAENIQVANLEPLLRLVRHRGDIEVARVYGNIKRQPGWVEAAAAHGLVLRHQAQLAGTKNGADIALAVDAMKLMHSGFPTGFCIVSADSDFVPLAQELRAAGRRVVGAGHRAACEALRLAYHDWLELGPVEPPVAPPDPLVEAVDRAMNGSEWIEHWRTWLQAQKERPPEGRWQTFASDCSTLRISGAQDRKGRIEIARPL